MKYINSKEHLFSQCGYTLCKKSKYDQKNLIIMEAFSLDRLTSLGIESPWTFGTVDFNICLKKAISTLNFY